jgi:hypothetical protein
MVHRLSAYPCSLSSGDWLTEQLPVPFMQKRVSLWAKTILDVKKEADLCQLLMMEVRGIEPYRQH